MVVEANDQFHPGREHSPELKDRVSRLMKFLRETVAAGTTPVLQVNKHLSHFWLADAGPYAQITTYAASGDVVVRAPKVTLDPSPEPPEALRGWIPITDRDNSDLDAPSLHQTGSSPTTPGERVPLSEAPGVQAAYDAWLPTWRSWAEVDRQRRPQHRLFQHLARAHQQLADQPESVEAVVAVGLLEVDGPRAAGTPIASHLLTQAVSIEQEPETGDFVCRFPEDSTIRLEDSQLFTGMDFYDLSSGDHLRNRVVDLVPALLADDTLAFLKEWAHRATNISVEVGDDTASLPMPRLRPSPALVLRKRGAFALLDYYDRIIKAAERDDEPVPLGIAQLIEAIEPDDRLAWLERMGNAAGSDLAVDPLFPLPANEEQGQIITRLGGDSGVVVEGPPGTGKTHTIANLMSSLLADGQRVLVTSEKAQALRVLRDKLPDEMQELCVSITDVARGGSAELNKSVASLAARKSSFSPAAEDRQVADLTERRDQARRRRSSLLEQIRALREQETYLHPDLKGAPGYAGTAAAIAQKVRDRRDEFGWMPQPARGPVPVTAAELQEILELHRGWTPLRDERPAQAFPAVASRPALGLVASLSERVATGAVADHGTTDPRLQSLLRAEGLDLLAVARELRTTDTLVQELRQSPFDWAEGVADLVLGGRHGYLWDRAAEHGPLIERAVHADQHVGRIRVEGVGEEDEAARRAFTALADFLHAGGSLKKVFKSDQQKAAEPWLAAVTVDGQPVTTADQARLVQAHLDAYAMARELADLLQPLGATVSTGGPRPVLVGDLLQVRDALARIETLRTQVASLKQVLEATTGHLDLTSVVKVDELTAAASAVVSTHDAKLARAELEGMARQVEEAIPAGAVAPESHALVAALRASDAPAYATALQELAVAEAEQQEQRRYKELLAQLRGGSQKVAALVVEDASESTWLDRLTQWGEAWAWAVAASWLDEQSDPELDSRLNAQLSEVDADLSHTTAKLAAAKAWRSALTRMTAEQVQGLQSYRDALANVGMGTGKYAERFRQAARSAMQVAQGAVPAWVMPLQQVLASIPAEQNSFDVVIIDEASQADITSLFLLWLAPRVIVVGDDKQCAPSEVSSGALDKVFDRLDSYLFDVPVHLRATLTPRSSIFSMLRTRFGQVIRLREHFRCMPEIIGWSSQMFYRDAPLVPVRQFGADRLPPLRTSYVPGGYVEGKYATLHNPPEAEAIVDQLQACLEDPAYDGKTFGVVVLQGNAQVSVIQNALLNRIPSEVLDERRLRVGTPPDFQGDERHVVFLSMVVAPEQNFASLTKSEYQRRFNVAASRAQDQLWLFHSVTPDRLRSTDLRHSLLTYMTAATGAAVESMPERVTRDRKHTQFDSLFEQRVFLDLVERGYHVTPQVEVNSRRIDLVVTGRGSKLAVECDGDAWHSSPEQVQADLERELELRRCGWTFWRVRESEYYLDKERALSSLWTTLDERGIGPFQADEAESVASAGTQDDAPVWVPAAMPDDESPIDDKIEVDDAPVAVVEPPRRALAATPEAPAPQQSTTTQEPRMDSMRSDRTTSDHDAKVLSLMASGPVSNADVREATGLSVLAARDVLTDLMARGLVYRTGETRGTRYHLAAKPPASR